PSYDFVFLGRFRGTAPGLPPLDPDPSAPVYKAFRSEYTAHFHTENPDSTAFVANAYDAFFSIALAALAGGDDRSGAAITANLGRLSAADGDLISASPLGFSTALAALRAGHAVNLQ